MNTDDALLLVRNETDYFVDNSYPQDPTLELSHQLITSVCQQDFIASTSNSLYDNVSCNNKF